MKVQSLTNESQPIFVVDMDDSLLKTDLLLEKLVKLGIESPLRLLKAPFFLFRGKLAFKKWLNENVELDYSALPYRSEVLSRARSAKERGERTILLSAALQEDVNKVSDLLRVFDDSIGSQKENLKGQKKINYLKENYSSSSMTYIGDSFSDLKVWSECNKVIAINPSSILVSQINKLNKYTEYIFDENNFLALITKQIRVYQWTKNILVLLPVFAAHRFVEILPWINSLRAFVAFSFLASTVYVFNDICDLSSDRKQGSKKHRPLASGNLSLRTALFLMPACLFVSFSVCWGLGREIFLVLGSYLLMNIIYSFWVKKSLVMDVVFLAGFYTLRIFAGGAASDTMVSEWLLSFSVFFFFGLAMVKRYSELKIQSLSLVKGPVGRRSYDPQDLLTVLVSGISTSILSILILALYLSTGEVKRLYQSPSLLWFVTPCLLYWINRLWILGARGQVTEDPLIFALKDKTTWGVTVVIISIVLLAI